MALCKPPAGLTKIPAATFRLGGWIVPYADDAIGQDLQDLFSQPFELLLGRRTYDIFAAYWPRVPVDADRRALADRCNSVPKRVATPRSETLDWPDSHALEGDLADAIRALKQQDGATLLTWGSADMVRQLLAAGLVDELRLLMYPVVLGRGKPLFGDNAPTVGLHPGALRPALVRVKAASVNARDWHVMREPRLARLLDSSTFGRAAPGSGFGARTSPAPLSPWAKAGPGGGRAILSSASPTRPSRSTSSPRRESWPRCRLV